MIKHQLKELTKSSENEIHVDPEKAEQLKRTKTEIESHVTRILKLVKNGNKGKRDGNPKSSRKESHLAGLIEGFYKHYQSFNELHDHLREESEKAIQSRKEKEDAYLSSSDSEYYSSEETYSANSKLRNEQEKEDRNRSTNELEFEVQPSEVIEELGGELIRLKMAIGTLQCQRRELETWVASKSVEVEPLGKKHVRLKAWISELDSLLKKTGDEAAGSISVNYRKDDDNDAKSNLMEVNLLRFQNGELKKQFIQEKEALAQAEGLMEQLNGVRMELETILSEKNESEKRKDDQISKNLISMENLKEELAKHKAVERRILEEKGVVLVRIKEMELELDSLCNQRNEFEEQLRTKIRETNRLISENEGLQTRNSELERKLAHKIDEFASLEKKYEDSKTEASNQITVLADQVKNLKQDLDSMEAEKSQVEREKQEFALSKSHLENENTKLTSKISDQQKTLKQQEESIRNLNLNIQAAENKMEEVHQEFRKNLEDNIRLLSQRILVAEQLHAEAKISYKRDTRYEQQNKALEQKLAAYESEFTKIKQISKNSCNELNGIDLTVKKFKENSEKFLSEISSMSNEIRNAKLWVIEKNKENEKLKQSLGSMVLLLDEKEEQEFLLREKVWKLEDKVSKEGGEKVNLIKAISQFERKVRELEKNSKEKEEDLVRIADEKREAIRQLCLLNDYHRSCCNHLKEVICKLTVQSKTRK